MNVSNDNRPALKACPFCGNDLFVRQSVNAYGRCDTAGCWMNVRGFTVLFDDPAQVAAWNVRPVEDGLGSLLAQAIDTPLLTLPEPASGGKFNIELRLYSFLPDVANRAADLLEEIGL